MPIDQDKIRQLRTAKGLTLEAAARLAGLTDKSHLSRIENGGVPNPTLAAVEGLAEAYGVSIADLVTKGTPNTRKPKATPKRTAKPKPARG